MALLDCMTGVLANQAMNYLATGQDPTRLGNAHPNIAPYQVFAARDGHIILAVGNDRQFGKLCEYLGLALHEDKDFATNAARVAHRERLAAVLSAAFAARDKAALLDDLAGLGVPAGPINKLSEVFADPQVIARGMRIEADGVPGVRSPIRFGEAELSLDRGAPELGRDQDAQWKT